MCSKADEKINHTVCECPKLAQKEYKRKHDWIRRCIHWEICGRKFVERMESMLNRNGMSINHKRSLRRTLVKSFGILLYRQIIL